MISTIVKGLQSLVQSLGLFASFDYQPISPEFRKRCPPTDVLEESSDKAYQSYAVPSKRPCLSDIKSTSQLVSEEEHNSLKDVVNTFSFYTSLLQNQAKEHAAEKEDMRKLHADAEDESRKQAQISESKCEALNKELTEVKAATAKEVQDLKSEKATLLTKLVNRNRAVTKIRSHGKKVVAAQRKKAFAAGKQTQVWRMAARLVAGRLKKETRSNKVRRDQMHSQFVDKLEKERKLTKTAQDETKAVSAQLQVSQDNRPDVEMEDADHSDDELAQAKVKIADHQRKLRRKGERTRRSSERHRELGNQFQAAAPLVESQDHLLSPPPSSEFDTSITADLDQESDLWRPQSSGLDTLMTTDFQPEGDNMERDIDGQDLDVQSPTELQPSFEGTDLHSGSEPVFYPESEQERPALKVKNGAKNHLGRDRSSRSRTGQQSRAAVAGVSKASRTLSQSGNGNKRSQKYNSVRPASARSTLPRKRARYPWMAASAAPEKLLGHAGSAPMKVPAPKHNAANSDFVLPSDASKRIRDIEVTKACIEAYEAYDAGDHAGLRAQGQSGMFYELPRSDTLIFYSPHGVDRVYMAKIDRPDVWQPSKNWYLPAFEEINAVAKDKANYERACVVAKLPETHGEAVKLYEKAAIKKNPKLEGLVDKFMRRSPYTAGELWTNPKYVGQMDQLFRETSKELSTLPAFQHAAIAWASGKSSDGNSCWPPKFIDPFIREKTTNPKYWVRNELDDLANTLRTTAFDTSADSLLGSLGCFSVDGSSPNTVKSPGLSQQTGDKE